MPHLPSPLLSAGMRAACAEGRRWLGTTSPNPPVGAAALDESGAVLAVAAHRRAGSDHAEAALLKLCREREIMPRVHTICVTMEPCNHTGRTPPCSAALLAAGIRHVAIGVPDPNPRVTGGGALRLREAGIDVVGDIERGLCAALQHAFLFHARTGRPFVTVKRAFDTTGSMIPPVGQKTFTAPESLRLAHRLRKKADAIVTGSGTILADSPLFTVRHVPDFADKKRVLAILDRRRRVPEAYVQAATQRGFDVQRYSDPDSCFSALEKQGLQDILVESGPDLSDSILESPHWTLKIDIHAGNPGKVDVFAQDNAEIGFTIRQLGINVMLPD